MVPEQDSTFDVLGARECGETLATLPLTLTKPEESRKKTAPGTRQAHDLAFADSRLKLRLENSSSVSKPCERIWASIVSA